jgi:diguanylate cyclase
MTLLVDLTFLLLAASGGAFVTWFVMWLRAAPAMGPIAEAEAHFAHETLTRLQDLTRSVAAEVDQHAECVQEINAQLANTEDNDEGAVLAAVSQLIEANRRMQGQLDSAEERLKAQAQQIESHAVEARTDALTQVANRRALDDELARCVADFERRGVPSTVMLLDVDHFKKFNDTHGHQAGDDALRTVARAVRQSVGEVGLVARYGGEEFAVVFAGLSSAAAIPYCERARQSINAVAVRVAARDLRITASAGVAEVMTGDSEPHLIGRADEGLYASKKGGRNCGHFNDGSTNHRLKLQEPASRAAAPAATSPEKAKVGDEWLFDADVPAEKLFGESIPNISNRPAFFDDLIRRLSQWRRGGPPLTLLVLQVDSYDQIVTDHGSSCAEAVLRIAAQLVNAVLRDMDHVSRLSEDTFALLLPGALLSDGITIAERLRLAVERCRLPRKAGTSWFTISAGVIEASEGDDLRRILERGRSALAAAVNQGRNCVVGRDANGVQVRKEEAVET